MDAYSLAIQVKALGNVYPPRMEEAVQLLRKELKERPHLGDTEVFNTLLKLCLLYV